MNTELNSSALPNNRHNVLQFPTPKEHWYKARYLSEGFVCSTFVSAVSQDAAKRIISSAGICIEIYPVRFKAQ